MIKKLFSTLFFSFLLACPGQGIAGDISKAHTYIDGEVLTAALLNASVDEIIIEANDLDGDNLASDIAITTSGNMSVTGTASFTGSTITLGDGADAITINASSGITFTPAATWTFSAAQTVSGTWADLGIVTTVDINGGTVDGVTIGGASAGAITCTTLNTGGKLTAGANEVEGSLFDINGGAIDGVTIGGASAPTVTDLGSVATCDINGGTLDGVQIGGTTATGELIVNNASDDADGLGSQGTSGQVLTSAGTGSNPAFANTDMQLISSAIGEVDNNAPVTASGLSSGKNYYVVMFIDDPINNPVFSMEINDDRTAGKHTYGLVTMDQIDGTWDATPVSPGDTDIPLPVGGSVTSSFITFNIWTHPSDDTEIHISAGNLHIMTGALPSLPDIVGFFWGGFDNGTNLSSIAIDESFGTGQFDCEIYVYELSQN